MLRRNVIFSIYLILSVIVAVSSRYVQFDFIQISSSWYRDHGCPKEGKFLLNCNEHYCPKAGFKEQLIEFPCSYGLENDTYKEGDACEPNQFFYSTCKRCQCYYDGSGAKCDNSACTYYALDEITATTSLNNTDADKSITSTVKSIDDTKPTTVKVFTNNQTSITSTQINQISTSTSNSIGDGQITTVKSIDDETTASYMESEEDEQTLKTTMMSIDENRTMTSTVKSIDDEATVSNMKSDVVEEILQTTMISIGDDQTYTTYTASNRLNDDLTLTSTTKSIDSKQIVPKPNNGNEATESSVTNINDDEITTTTITSIDDNQIPSVKATTTQTGTLFKETIYENEATTLMTNRTDDGKTTTSESVTTDQSVFGNGTTTTRQSSHNHRVLSSTTENNIFTNRSVETSTINPSEKNSEKKRRLREQLAAIQAQLELLEKQK